jgi:signal transduction histidine kinase
MAPAVEAPSFAEWERSFVLRRIRIMIWLAIAVLGTYIAVAVATTGWRSPTVVYFSVAELLMVAVLVLRETPLVRRHVDLALVATMVILGFITLKAIQPSVSASPADAALLVGHTGRWALSMIFVAAAVTLPTRWHAHVVSQGVCLGVFYGLWPDVFATLAAEGQLVQMTLGQLWIFVICDLSVFLYSRLQRSEFEIKGELEAVARQRGEHLDGLVRIGISAAASDPGHQQRAVLDELIRQLGAERVYLYLTDGEGGMAFQAGRSAAGEELDARSGEGAAERLVSVPLRMRDRMVGEIRLERPEGGATGVAADFLRALASHAAIAIETVRSTEELRVARDRALAAGRAKDAFLRTMSHELRTPLNAMIGYSEMLVEDLDDAGDAEHAADARRVQGAASHLLGIIADILELTKIEADRSSVVAVPFEVAELARAVEEALRPEAERNENRLEVSVAHGAGSMTSDRSCVELVLKRLLENACKFTRKGKVGCEVERETRDGADWILFRVSDTGIGMTEEALARCFEPFYQADPSATREYGGAGLGLTTAVRLCEMLGGAITARSAPGEGSTFEVTLPAVFDSA